MPGKELPNILVVDDDQLALETLKRTLRGVFNVFAASSAAEADEILRFEYIQVVLCDHRMPGETGVDFLTRVRDEWPEVIRILISGYSDFEDTVRSVNEAGIYQYIEKPWQPEQLILTLKNAIELYELQRENRLLSVELKVAPTLIEKENRERREKLINSYSCDDIVRTPDGLIDQVIDKLCTIAEFDFPVLITGGSGTGKELFARALHYNSSRAAGAFMAENCGALPDDLLESELFGYKKGAFTGAYMDHVGIIEQASGGTLFLDEIGEVSPAFQVKLLRVLQEGEIRPLGHAKPRKVDIRIVAATNRNLEEEVKAGRFREDLYYRLTGYKLHLPDLNDRKEDILLLANHYLDKLCQQYGFENKGFSEEMNECMVKYRWPGNIRELQNEIGRAFMLTPKGQPLSAEYLSPVVLRCAPEEMEMEVNWVASTNGSLKEKIAKVEEKIVYEALVRQRWNKTKVAEELGLSRVGLRQKIERFGILDKKNEKLETAS